MTGFAALLLGTRLALQATAPWTAASPAPTVGDTVVLTRTFPGATAARVRPLAGTAAVEPLSDPAAVSVRGGVVVRYAIALFAPGPHALAMPDLELLRPGGAAETVPGDTARVTVASVLPPGDTIPPPRPSMAPLPQGERRLLATIVLVGAVLVSSATWWHVRRRRGPRPPFPPTTDVLEDAPLDRWMDAGEARAVAAVAADRLRRALARGEPGARVGLVQEELMTLLRAVRPEWPLDDIAATLAALERARYAPAVPGHLMALATRARELADRCQVSS